LDSLNNKEMEKLEESRRKIYTSLSNLIEEINKKKELHGEKILTDNILNEIIAEQAKRNNDIIGLLLSYSDSSPNGPREKALRQIKTLMKTQEAEICFKKGNNLPYFVGNILQLILKHDMACELKKAGIIIEYGCLDIEDVEEIFLYIDFEFNSLTMKYDHKTLEYCICDELIALIKKLCLKKTSDKRYKSQLVQRLTVTIENSFLIEEEILNSAVKA
jgi:hypothetical protein